MQRVRKDVRSQVKKRKKEEKKKSHLQTNVLLHPHTQSAGAAESMQPSSGIFLCIYNNTRSHCGPAPEVWFAVSAALLLQICNLSIIGYVLFNSRLLAGCEACTLSTPRNMTYLAVCLQPPAESNDLFYLKDI